LEVADIFRDHGSAWRHANQGRLSHAQLKVMSAIEGCRTAALGGHVARCENPACGHTAIAYCSCRDRHCPKCQGSQARKWLQARQADLCPVLGDAEGVLRLVVEQLIDRARYQQVQVEVQDATCEVF
jgi:hypothetical protein